MHRPQLYFKIIHSWNKLVYKFYNLYKRIVNLNKNQESSSRQINFLLNKLQKIYIKLYKLQTKTGIKIAGSALALMLANANLNAQSYTFQGVVTKGVENIYAGTYATPTYADIDGDGDMDLFIGEYNGTISEYKNDGSGNFVFSEKLKADGNDINISYYSSPAFADLDNDGDMDLYIGEYYGKINVFTNDGNGNFSFSGNLLADAVNIDVGSHAVPTFADIDKDSDLDLFIGETDGLIHTYTNDGSGIFTSAGNLKDNLNNNIDAGYFSSPAFADIDSDGDLDLYIGERDGMLVYTNDSGIFTYSGVMQAGGIDMSTANFYYSPTFEDIDKDGDLDLYIGDKYGNVKVAFNTATVFSSPIDLQASNQLINVIIAASPEFADIDKDSDLDLYIGNYNGYIIVYTNDGTGTFNSAGNLQADGTDINIGAYSSPIFADIDKDNDLDLYIGDYLGYIKVYSNDGSGVFTSSGNLQAGGIDIDLSYNATPVFADIDGDSDLDLYIGERSGTIKVYTNSGGSFTFDANLQADGTDIDAGTYISAVFADIDGDSDLDLYVGEKFGAIKVYTNNGGIFNAMPNLQSDSIDIDVGDWSSPVFVDIDKDGDLDLYIGEKNGNILFYRNEQFNRINTNETKDLLVYPNPTKGQITVANVKSCKIQITDINGRIIKEYNNITKTNLQIDLTGVAKGMYFIKTYNNIELKTSKIIIE